jgi:hypothetical protein
LGWSKIRTPLIVCAILYDEYEVLALEALVLEVLALEALVLKVLALEALVVFLPLYSEHPQFF